jgi:hypothetical protein
MKDNELDQLLKAAVAPSRVPASFQREVWIRIAAEESMTYGFNLKRMLNGFLDLFAVPKIAVATCSAMILVGSLLGIVSVRTDLPSELSYVESISPFAQENQP